MTHRIRSSSLAAVAVCVLNGLATAGLNDGVIARYSFSGNADDTSGNGLNGTVFGATLTTDANGAPDGAYLFDAFMDRIGIPVQVLDNQADFSLFMVVRFDSMTSEPTAGVTLLSAANANQDNEVWLGARVGSQLGGIVKGQNQTSSVTFQLGEWFTLGWLRNHTTGGMDVYRNGQLADSLSLGIGLLDVDPDGLWLGLDQDGVSGGWSSADQLHGALDEAHFYNRLLAPSEVSKLHDMYIPEPASVLLLAAGGLGLICRRAH